MRRIECKHVVNDHGLEDVELHVALAAGDRHGHVVAHHLRAGHRQRFGLGRVDLARHDRGAGFVFRQDQFAETRAWAGAQQADVVGDLEQRHRDRVEHAGEFDQCIVGGEGFEFVLRA